MRLNKIRWKRAERPNWALPFFAGLLLGGVVVFWNSALFLTDGGLWNLTDLERIGRLELNKSVFFFYVLRKRLGLMWMAMMLATTFAGVVTTYLLVFWMGICGGVAAASSVLRYGIKGVLLLAAGMMPQFLLYIPAFLLLADWCVGLCMRLYYPVMDYTAPAGKPAGRVRELRRLLLLHGVVIIGAVLESYVNPNLLAELVLLF